MRGKIVLVCAGVQAEMQKLKEEVISLRTKLKDVSIDAKRDQKNLEKARARAATLDKQLKLMRLEHDERLQQMQHMEKEAQQ